VAQDGAVILRRRTPSLHLNLEDAMRLTDQGIRALSFTQRGQREYPDAAVPGLLLRVGRRTKTFMLLVNHRRERKRYTIGRYDPPHFTLAMAREKGKDLAAEHRLTPLQPRKLSHTYQEALRTYFATHSAQRHRATTRTGAASSRVSFRSRSRCSSPTRDRDRRRARHPRQDTENAVGSESCISAGPRLFSLGGTAPIARTLAGGRLGVAGGDNSREPGC
jgi:hypothetical protein